MNVLMNMTCVCTLCACRSNDVCMVACCDPADSEFFDHPPPPPAGALWQVGSVVKEPRHLLDSGRAWAMDGWA